MNLNSVCHSIQIDFHKDFDALFFSPRDRLIKSFAEDYLSITYAIMA